ncbi:MAG: RNA polymerase Rpb4 family protein [Candidatus Hadarchaeota archaeon]
MIGDEVRERRPVTFSESLEILKNKKEEKELEFEQRLAYDYVQKFSQLSTEKTKELLSDLLEIEKIRDHQAVILANNMPETKEDIDLIFAKERTSLREETVDQILDIVDKYRE